MLADTALIFIVAFGLAASGTPVARRLALRSRFVDLPAPRKDHAGPMPLLGGLAIYAAVLGSLLLFPDRRHVVEASGILVGATLISFLGVWDDRGGLSLPVKLGGQIAAALILVVGGVQAQLPVPAWLNLALTFLWVLGITNALNLVDNMDGLAGGIGAVAAATFLALAGLNGQVLVGALAAALLGACLGFLIYNFNPARIFMGDSGSLFLGFTLAATGIKLRFPDNVSWVTWMVPVLVLGVPILDTTLVVVSRLRRGRNPLTTPGRDHLSHRLASRGAGRRGAVLGLYGAAVLFGVAAVLVSLADPIPAYVVGALAAVAGLAALWWLERAPQGRA
ncbi:MAG: MraY family glycosyltransferase [Thermoanaerobaculia bacterium]|nr:MraY family glycosyltransferase [Thermoanaerobaculia bacterium]